MLIVVAILRKRNTRFKNTTMILLKFLSGACKPAFEQVSEDRTSHPLFRKLRGETLLYFQGDARIARGKKGEIFSGFVAQTGKKCRLIF